MDLQRKKCSINWKSKPAILPTIYTMDHPDLTVSVKTIDHTRKFDILTLKAPIMAAADDNILRHLSSIFEKNKV